MKLALMLMFTLTLTYSCFAQNAHNSWLQGNWKGHGVQMDGAAWSMYLRVKNKKITIEYPSLKCRGYWKLIRIDSKRARLLERIPNSGTCFDKLTVQISKISHSRLRVKFSSAVDDFMATAVLWRVGDKRVLTAEKLK